MKSQLALVVVLIALLAAVPPRAQQQDVSIQKVPKPSFKVTYLLPLWLYYQTESADRVAEEVSQLRQRLGSDGQYVRLGFALYIFVDMNNWTINPDDAGAVRAELAGTIAQIDSAIARALPHNLPICLSVITALRERYDPVQLQAEREDRRNTQWYWSNGLAGGWMTHSRYARKLRRVQEAYVREIGKVIANRMARYPGIVVAASGDGEVELSFERTFIGGNPDYSSPATQELADYSPFAILEFRDWVRNGGLYAAGQPFEGQGYDTAARYERDPSPATDGNGDGRTFNGDFGTSFTSWDLRYFDWSIGDNPNGDPNAIPASVYEAPGFNPKPDAGATRFDAPRTLQPGNRFWDLWVFFKQVMIWRHNLDFARWMTSSTDAETGLTVPVERFFSDQIPADYVFGGSPQAASFRLDTSASPWWTADISPHGSLGITAFNAFDPSTGQLFPTLRNVAPVIANQQVRWGILEYHSSVPLAPDLQVHRDDMAVLERHRPTLVVPIYWGDPYYQIQNTPLEQALREWVTRTKDTPPAPRTVVELESRSLHQAAGSRTAPVATPAVLQDAMREMIRQKRARQSPHYAAPQRNR